VALVVLAAPLAAVLWLVARAEDRDLVAGREPMTPLGESLC
jgi:hypothetical protein